MGWDENGMWTPDEFRQPLGALGAFTNYMNASRSRELYDVNQRQRMAQAANLEEQNRQREEDYKRENEMRGRLSKLYEGQGTPTWQAPKVEDVEGAVLPFTKDPGQAMPWLRGVRSSQAKTDVAKLNSITKMWNAMEASGRTIKERMILLKGMFPPQEIQDWINSGVDVNKMGPLPEARAAESWGKGEKAHEESKVVGAQAAASIRLKTAQANLADTTAKIRKILAKGGRLKPSEEASFSARLEQAIQLHSAMVNRKPHTDELTGLPLELTPEQEAQNEFDLARVQHEIEELTDALDEARVPRKARAAGLPEVAGPGGAPPAVSGSSHPDAKMLADDYIQNFGKTNP